MSLPRYTVEDLEHFPEDGNRYELLNGQLLVTAAPRPYHQIAANRIATRLTNGTADSGVAQVVGPGAVSLPPLTHLEPDILVYPARFPIDIEWVDVDENWLAVEVLSNSSRKHDRELKRDAYVSLGLAEVWIVDTRAKVIEVSKSRGRFSVVRDEVIWNVPNQNVSVRVNLSEIFAGFP